MRQSLHSGEAVIVRKNNAMKRMALIERLLTIAAFEEMKILFRSGANFVRGRLARKGRGGAPHANARGLDRKGAQYRGGLAASKAGSARASCHPAMLAALRSSKGAMSVRACEVSCLSEGAPLSNSIRRSNRVERKNGYRW